MLPSPLLNSLGGHDAPPAAVKLQCRVSFSSQPMLDTFNFVDIAAFLRLSPANMGTHRNLAAASWLMDGRKGDK